MAVDVANKYRIRKLLNGNGVIFRITRANKKIKRLINTEPIKIFQVNFPLIDLTKSAAIYGASSGYSFNIIGTLY